MLPDHSNRLIDVYQERQEAHADGQKAFGCALEFVGGGSDIGVEG
jgi:hypothetical protein